MRVSEALDLLGLKDTAFLSESAAIRGTHVHEATVMIDEGDLRWEALDPVLEPYCRAYVKWLDEKKPKILRAEYRVEILDVGFSGTLDRLIEMDGRQWLVDLKTGAKQPWHRWQVALYSVLYQMKHGGTAPVQSILYLNPEGRYQWDQFKNPWQDRERAKSLIVAAGIIQEVKGAA